MISKKYILIAIMAAIVAASVVVYYFVFRPVGPVQTGACGDGICDAFEKGVGLCPQDCGNNQQQTNNISTPAANSTATKRTDLTTDSWKKYIDANAPAVYLNVVVNVSDFIQIDKSAKYVEKAVDLFTELNIKADFSFTEPVARRYAEKYPNIINKIKNNTNFSIGYHLRPPYPAVAVNPRATFADETGNCKTWDSLNHTEKESLLKSYEKYALDVSGWKYDTANYCSKLDKTKPGGYDSLKEIFGKSPLGFGRMAAGEASDILFPILKAKGARSFVGDYAAGKNDLFIEKDGWLLRPSDFNSVFADAWKRGDAYRTFYDLEAKITYRSERPVIGNLLVHDYDFYYQDTWYLQTGRGDSLLRSDSDQVKFWSDYERTIRAFAKNSQVKTANTRDFLDMNEKYKSNF